VSHREGEKAVEGHWAVERVEGTFFQGASVNLFIAIIAAQLLLKLIYLQNNDNRDYCIFFCE
jgi:hypothetical protein